MKQAMLIAALALSFSDGAVLAQTNDSAPPPPQSDAPAAADNQTPSVSNGRGGARFAAIQQACAGDMQSLCPGMRPGDGKLGACIRENRAKLSRPCGDALAAMRAARGGARRGQQ